MVRELAVDELAWRCPDDWVPWQSSSEIEPTSTIVGQDRAVDAIAFGLAIGSIGYNVFVTGLSGTGRLTTISRFLDQLASDAERPDDVCFVHNFRTPEEPSALFLRAGAGRRFKLAMEGLVRELSANLPGITVRMMLREYWSSLREREGVWGKDVVVSGTEPPYRRSTTSAPCGVSKTKRVSRMPMLMRISSTA